MIKGEKNRPRESPVKKGAMVLQVVLVSLSCALFVPQISLAKEVVTSKVGVGVRRRLRPAVGGVMRVPLAVDSGEVSRRMSLEVSLSWCLFGDAGEVSRRVSLSWAVRGCWRGVAEGVSVMVPVCGCWRG